MQTLIVTEEWFVTSKEIFCTSIPPSKNNFKAKVPRELVLPAEATARGFMSPNMGKAVDDIEMGRKAVWKDMGQGDDRIEGQLCNNDGMNIIDGALGEMSPEIRTTVKEPTEQGGIHPSSWARKSGCWVMSPEVLSLAARVGDSSHATGSSSNLAISNRPRD